MNRTLLLVVLLFFAPHASAGNRYHTHLFCDRLASGFKLYMMEPFDNASVSHKQYEILKNGLAQVNPEDLTKYTLLERIKFREYADAALDQLNRNVQDVYNNVYSTCMKIN